VVEDTGPARITALSFPTPEVVKTTTNPADWDEFDRFRPTIADGASRALGLLDERLAEASTIEARTAVFESAYEYLADWRYRLTADGVMIRPGSDAEIVRTPIGDGSMFYRLTPSVAGREPGSLAYRVLTRMEQVALDQLGSADRLRHPVTLPDGRTINGNLLIRIRQLPEQAPDVFGPSVEQMAAAPPVLDPDETITVTATRADRDVLRRTAFDQFANLETWRAETGRLDVRDPANRQAFIDAAYFLYQGPEFRRGTDATMRALLAATHTRLFGVAPVIPHAIDLDATVRGQQGFRDVMRDQLCLETSHCGGCGIRTHDAGHPT
jgi:hypothetical protein